MTESNLKFLNYVNTIYKKFYATEYKTILNN